MKVNRQTKISNAFLAQCRHPHNKANTHRGAFSL